MTQKQLDTETLSHPFTEHDWKDLVGEKFSDLRVIDAKKAKLDNRPAHFATFDLSYETIQARVHSRSVNVVTFSPGYFWHLSCMGAGSTVSEAQSSFAHWFPSFIAIMNSFVFEQ